MAALLGAQAGRAPFLMNGEAPGANYLGTPANLTNVSTNQVATIPTDPGGSAYKAVIITASGSVWINFSSDSTAATLGGANCFLVTAFAPLVVVPPAGATKVAAIVGTGTTAADVCIAGLY